jgi:hypothetical protein
LEAWSGWQNKAEAGIRENKKKGISQAKRRTNSPKQEVWDFCGSWVPTIQRLLTVHDIPGLEGHVPPAEEHI